MTLVILFVFGAIVGSFLNVFALRFNSGLSLGGRSFCGACGRKLNWHELIPIISFLLLGGRCSKCRAGISWQYPLVELWTALIFVTVPLAFLPIFCLYIAITVYDLRHKIIPDSLVYATIIMSLIFPLLFIHYSLLDWLAGPIIFSFFALIWLLSRGRAMGFGDAKLGLSIGLLLGATLGFSAIILAFWLGAAFGIFYLIISRITSLLREAKNITMKSAIPFAPFMVLGAWLSLILEFDLLNVSSF